MRSSIHQFKQFIEEDMRTKRATPRPPFHETWSSRSIRPQPVNVPAVPCDVFHNEPPGLRDVLDEVEGAAAGGRASKGSVYAPPGSTRVQVGKGERPTA